MMVLDGNVFHLRVSLFVPYAEGKSLGQRIKIHSRWWFLRWGTISTTHVNKTYIDYTNTYLFVVRVPTETGLTVLICITQTAIEFRIQLPFNLFPQLVKVGTRHLRLKCMLVIFVSCLMTTVAHNYEKRYAKNIHKRLNVDMKKFLEESDSTRRLRKPCHLFQFFRFPPQQRWRFPFDFLFNFRIKLMNTPCPNITQLSSERVYIDDGIIQILKSLRHLYKFEKWRLYKVCIWDFVYAWFDWKMTIQTSRIVTFFFGTILLIITYHFIGERFLLFWIPMLFEISKLID